MKEEILKGESTDLFNLLAIISQNGNYAGRHCLSLYHENCKTPHTNIYINNKIITRIETTRIKEICCELKKIYEIDVLEVLAEGKRDTKVDRMKKKILKGLSTKENSLVYLLYDSATNKGDYFTLSNGSEENLQGEEAVRIELNYPLDIRLTIALADLLNST